LDDDASSQGNVVDGASASLTTKGGGMIEGTGHASEKDAAGKDGEQRARLLDSLLTEPTESSDAPVRERPELPFDPALLIDPSLPAGIEANMVDGVRQHLVRYSNLNAIASALERVDHPRWLDAWDQALRAMRGARIVFHGTELGILPLRALAHGASAAIAYEPHPSSARLASGLMQKNRLLAWHQQHAEAAPGMTMEERQASFTAFNESIQIIASMPAVQAEHADWFVFPNIDHTLLGTGIVAAIRAFRTQQGNERAKVAPERARVFAQAIRWNYPGGPDGLDALECFRWSPYPIALDPDEAAWLAVTEPAHLGDLDLADFVPTSWNITTPALTSGTVNGFIVWFELDVAGVKLSGAPGANEGGFHPAFHYVDPFIVSAGEPVTCAVHVSETRMRVASATATTAMRQMLLPTWYVPMLLDARRNDAYAAALAAALKLRPDASVLDIGAGCGMLSMLAAQAGAGDVYGSEIQPAIQAAGELVVAANDLSDRVHLIARDCRKLKVPGDLPRRADLAVFEMFDCSLLGEGILHYLAYAREHLLADDAVYVPMAARLRGMLIEYRFSERLGVDIGLLNPYRYSPSFINVDASRLDYRPLSEPFEVFAFDFSTATAEPGERHIDSVCTADGVAGAVMFWIELQLDASTTLSSAPGEAPLHWKQGLQLLPEATVEAGQALALDARHDGSSTAFRWREGALPAERFSRLPRLDPQHWRQMSALEEQTGQLLRHCLEQPDEYRKVASLAAAIAVDPAAHGVDPRIAQRFFAMLHAR
jgi:protein arginine N-methyltransferase 7